MPNMNDKEKKFFISCINGKNRYVEYGCGESTLIARKHCKDVISIETDREWAKQYNVFHCDMGNVSDWGYPSKEPSIQQLNHYFSFAKNFDILLIDGRYRVGVALHADTGLILIHDCDRKEYKIIEQYMDVVNYTDTLYLFNKRKITDISLQILTNPL
jgi:hypothetical protein